MKQSDLIIYGCVIVGAGIGLIFNYPLPGVLVGLGIGFFIQSFIQNEEQ